MYSIPCENMWNSFVNLSISSIFDILGYDFFLNDRSIYNQPGNFESTTNFVYKFIWTINNLNINTGFNAQRVGLGLSADWIPLFPVWHCQHETCSSSPCLDSSSRFAAPRSRCWDTPSHSPYWFYLAWEWGSHSAKKKSFFQIDNQINPFLFY